MTARAENSFINMLLVGLAALAATRLLLIVIMFGRHYLNPDFSDYYTAGQALNAGLPIYINNVFHNPPIWDGATYLTRSGFLYPPLVAVLFQPLAILPYAVAKFIWIGVSIACVVGAMTIVARIDRDSMKLRAVLLLTILVAAFEPFVTLLEQGQIDGVTFILLIGAIAIMLSRKKHGFVAGVLVALAVLLKLQCGLFIPFLILRREWKALAGAVSMGVVLIILMLLVNGVQVTTDYVENRLPNFGGQAQTISKDEIPIPRGYKDGKIYEIPEEVSIASTATLVVAAEDVEGSASSIPSPYITFSVIFFSIMFGIVAFWQIRHGNIIKHFTPMQEFAYWQIALIVILLCGPLTWVMNVVWLLPVGFIMIYWFKKLENRIQAVFLAFATLGLLLAAIPDEWEFLPFLPENFHPELKYMIAEIIIFVALLFFISHKIPGIQKPQDAQLEG